MRTNEFLRRLNGLADRFGDGCWEWDGTKAVPNGGRPPYGVVQYRRRQWKAHRLAFFLYHGELPDGLWVCHRCDNPTCVNPDHLYAGTPTDNNRDTVKRGRRAAPKTHCKRGHEFTADNVLPAYQRKGVVHGRRCKICTVMLNKQSYERHSAKWYATLRAKQKSA